MIASARCPPGLVTHGLRHPHCPRPEGISHGTDPPSTPSDRWIQAYLNFIGNEGRDRVIAGFGSENYERLAAVKAEYDPENVFYLNHNIRPAGVA
jgi:hypothetical protein